MEWRKETLLPNYSGSLSLASSHMKGFDRSYNAIALTPSCSPEFCVHS